MDTPEKNLDVIPTYQQEDTNAPSEQSMMDKILELEERLSKSVPKAKLAAETIQQRIQWLYHDFTPFQRFIAQVIVIVLVAGAAVGVYIVSNKISPESNVMDTVDVLIAIATALFGLNSQASVMKLPDEKINK